MKENQKAVKLKLADRIANVRFSIKKRNWGMADMYKREYAGFKTFLNDGIDNQDMWIELDKLLSE